LLDLLVRGGRVVTEQAVFEADVGIEDGKVVSVSRSSTPGAGRTIDATGKLVLPGAIDPHTHLNNTYPFYGVKREEDFESASIAAACGGVTTFIDFASQVTVSDNPRRCKTLFETVGEWRSNADPKVSVDYSLHVIVKEVNETTLDEIPKLIQYGVPSFKVYMAYNALRLDDGGIFSVMKQCGGHGGLVGVHCENKEIDELLEEKYRRQGKATAEFFAASHPAFSEAEAIQRSSILAQYANCPMNVVHLSTALGLEQVRAARRKGMQVFAETCPHYLTLTDEVYTGPNAINYRVSPPIRGKQDRAALWQGIVSGDIMTIGSDHVCFTRKQKELGLKDFTRAPPGLSGIEVLLTLAYSEGVSKRIIDISNLVQITSANTAKLFGLYPLKGIVGVGADADLVIFDPERRVRLTSDVLHSRSDHSIYEDITVNGYPSVTLSRGEVVFEEGQFAGKSGRGRFLQRRPFSVAS